jgi:predicted dehydrogenase
MKDRFRLAILGCGDITHYMAKMALINPKIRLTACCDNTEETANHFTARYKIPNYYTDYLEMVRSESPDAIYIATPHDLHYEMVMAAIGAQIPVLCEKPIIPTLKEGQEIVNESSKAQIKVGVNYQYHYDSGCFNLVHAARNDVLGKLLYGRCNIPWHRKGGYFDNSSWHGYLARSGGAPCSHKAATSSTYFCELQGAGLLQQLVSLTRGNSPRLK